MVPRHRADVLDVAHHPCLHVHTVRRRRAVGEHADLLRPHGVPPAVPLDDVRDPDEPCDELALGVLVDLRRRPQLLDAAAVEDGDPVAHRQCLFLVVRHVDERDPDLLLDPLQLDLHLLAELQVERSERLVQEEHLRLVHDRSRERHALALTARELRRLSRAIAGEPHHLDRGVGTAAPLLLPRPLDHEPVLDVLCHRHVWEEGVVLEDRVHRPVVGRQARDVVPGQLDRALVGELEARDHPQRRRLARSGRAEHREELPARDVEIDRVDRRHVAEALDETPEPDVGRLAHAAAAASDSSSSASPSPSSSSAIVSAGRSRITFP